MLGGPDQSADSYRRRLDPNVQSSQVQVLLEAIVEIIKARPQAVQPVLGKFYGVLGRYCHILGPTSLLLDHIRQAVGSPLLAATASGMNFPLPP